jgi:uncharacterized membrane protein YdbT with pleckstrin-like domain
MSYINRVLQSGETIVYASKLHWVVYLWGWLVVAVGILGVILLPHGTAYGLFLYASLAVCAAGLGILLVAWVKRVTTEIAVTNKRLIYKEGFISRRTMEMNMDKIESVDVNQSIIGRMFDYGTIVVRGTGAGLEPLKRIDAPIELRNSVMTTSSAASSAGAAVPKPAT